MGANAVSKVLKCVDKTSTVRTIKLYDDKSDFCDYDGGKYFAIYDGTAVRYAYCSDKLWTTADGNTTSCLIAKFIDKIDSEGNPHIRYMYTEQPTETEQLVKTVTSSASNTELLSQASNEYGAYIYVVNTKGKNGNRGTNGSSGWTSSSGSGAYTTYKGNNGGGGSGGSGGSGGTTVTTSLSIGDKTLNVSLAGMPGAGGGGGGGGGVGSGSSTKASEIYLTSGGSGGSGGSANNSSKAYRIKIMNGNIIKGNITIKANDSTYSGKSGGNGTSAYLKGTWATYTGAGGNGGSAGDGNGGGSGGSGGANYKGHSNPTSAGNGGNGGNAGDSRSASVSGSAVNNTARHGQQFNSSSNSFSNAIASNGGVVITKIVASYPV